MLRPISALLCVAALDGAAPSPDVLSSAAPRKAAALAARQEQNRMGAASTVLNFSQALALYGRLPSPPAGAGAVLPGIGANAKSR